MNNGRLHHVDTRNPKEIVLEGLKSKAEELGTLRVPFVFTLESPSKETFRRVVDGDEVAERRIVIRRTRSPVSQYGIGQMAAADYIDGEEVRYQGWVEEPTIEIDIWTTASDDRDNIMELIKVWMLELEQDTIDDVPFFYEHGIQAVTFRGMSERVDTTIVQNGPMYIGTLTYDMLATFFNEVEPDELMKYKINLVMRLMQCDEELMTIHIT